MVELLKALKEGFGSRDYNLNEISRFFEFQIRNIELFDENFAQNLSKAIMIKGLDQLGSKLNMDLRPWGFSIVYPETPMSDHWLHIAINSDIFSPSRNASIRVTRRTETEDEMLNFLEILPETLNEVINLYVGEI